MDTSNEFAKSSTADGKHQRLAARYLPIAFAAVGCVAVIAIAFEGQDLSNRRSAWDRSKLAREKIMADSSFIDHNLIVPRRELESIGAKQRFHQQTLPIAQNELEKAQKYKVTALAVQEKDKAAGERSTADIDRAAAQKLIEVDRDQFEDGRKRLLFLKDKLMRGQVKFANLIYQQPRLKLMLPQTTVDGNRLQGAAKRLEDEIRLTAKQKGTIALDVDRNRGHLRQLKPSVVGQKGEIDGFKRMTDDLRKQSEDRRKDVAELERKHAALALQTKATALTLADQSNREQRKGADLRSRNADLDVQRIGIEQEIKALQQQNEDLVKTNESFEVRLDAATTNLARVMEQIKALEPDRREVVALQATLEELNRQIDERRKMIDRPAKPTPRSHLTPPAPLGATDPSPRAAH
jgi:hypothetical protein